MAYREINKENVKQSYSEKLSDPRWQRLRIKILNRDKNRCTYCQTNENIQVHHLKYTGEPWQAPESDLITVCDCCHRILEDFKTRFSDAKILAIKKLDYLKDKHNVLYRVVFAETHKMPDLILLCRFKKEEQEVVYWGDFHELMAVMRELKAIKYKM